MLQTSALQLAPAALDNAMREQARVQNRWLPPIYPYLSNDINWRENTDVRYEPFGSPIVAPCNKPPNKPKCGSIK